MYDQDAGSHKDSLKNLRPEEVQRLEVLSKIGKRINTPDSFSETLRAVLDSVVDSMEAERGALFLTTDPNLAPQLSLWADRTVDGDGGEFRYSTTVVEKVWRDQRPLAEVDAQENEDLADRKSIMAEGIRSVICVPLIGRLSKLGVLYLDNTITSAFTMADLQMLDVIADLASTALERSRFFDDLQTLNNQLEQRVHDRTAEAESAMREAERANRAKSLFLAKMSHELRTPLNGVLGLTEDLARREDDPVLRLQLNQVVDSARSLATMINGVLDYSKLESEQTTLDLHPFKIEKAIVAALASVNYEACKKGLELQVWIDDTCPQEVEGDSVRLKQILINLLGNAVKFTQQGWVRLIVHAMGPGVLQFSVADSGIGIAPEKQADIFRPFSQADTSTTREYGGTGLGLSISQTLCRLMGGELYLESTPNQGSRFTFQVALRFLKSFDPPNFEGARMAVRVASPPLKQALERALKGWGVEMVEPEQARVVIYSGDTPPNARAAIRLFLPQEEVVPGAKLAHTGYLLTPVTRTALITEVRALLEPTESSLEAVATASADPLPPSGSRALVVEDHEINQLVAKRMLKGWGYTAVFADNGQQAMEMVAAGEPRIILMDIEMPGQDGYQTAMLLRAHGWHRVPIVAVTAHLAGDLRERCLASGMDDLVGKPLSREVLGRRLALWESVLNGEKTRNEARHQSSEGPKNWPSRFIGLIESSLSTMEALMAQGHEGELQAAIARLRNQAFSAGLFEWGSRLVRVPAEVRIQEFKPVFDSFRQEWPILAPTLATGSKPG